MWVDNATDQTWQQLADKFNAESGHGMVQLQVVPAAQYLDKLQTALSSGNGPDAARMKDEWIGQFVKAGVLAPLSKKIDAWSGKSSVISSSWDAGKVPGKTAKGNLRSYVGALAITNKRVLGTLSTVPKKAGRAVDHPWHADAGSMVTATLDGSGLTLDVSDLSVVDPAFAGGLSLHYKSALADDVLVRLPQRSFAFDVPPKFVYSAVGVPHG